MGRPRDAAKLALDYCSDVEGAISLLLDAHAWLEVARLAYLYDKTDVLSMQLEPAVLECASTELKNLNEGVQKIGKYLARFMAVREQRLLFEAKIEADKQGWDAIEDDASSDISLANSTHSNVSGLSGLSAYTFGNSRIHSTTSSVIERQGRRQVRAHKSEGRRIRAGSVGEESALMEYLKGMALGKGHLEELHVLMGTLMQLGHESNARDLHQAVSRFNSVQKDAEQQTQENSSDCPVPKDLVDPSADVHWQWEILQ